MLTTQELIAAAPAAAARTPAAHCSARYSFIPTLDAIDALRKEGYVPVAARQDAAGEDRWGRNLHCKHSVTLRLKGTEMLDRNRMMGGLVPELRMYNSSDGGSPFQLAQGIWRQVCSNGLIIMVEEVGINTVHRGVTAEEVIERARKLSQQSKPLFDKIQRWTKIRLDPVAQNRFAAQALSLRLGGDAERAKKYDLASMIAPRRDEDAEPTLWNLFNRVQENGMKGLVEPRANIEDRRGLGVRPLIGINAERKFNADMWALAEKWGAYVK